MDGKRGGRIDDLKEARSDSKSCLCYTTNLNYAFPTLLSAVQARNNLSECFDVIVILIETTCSEFGDLVKAHETEDVLLVTAPPDAIDGLPIDFARYFLDRILESRYRQITHIDGDTHILGSLDPLLNFEITSGRLLAVLDPLALLATTSSPVWCLHRERLTKIGLNSNTARRYVNTGLFSARREDFAHLRDACCTLTLRENSRMRFGQQDAFNVALQSAIDLASLRWNYPAFFSNFQFDHLVAPRVRHFMSNPRPWQAPFPPWGQTGHAPYLNLVLRYPALTHLLRPLPVHQRVRYEVQQRIKRFVEPLFWDTAHLRCRIAEHEATAII